jgi:pyridoxamine 5'-phosphate oxidase
MNLSEIRQEYTLKTLNERDVDPNPIEQLKIWLNEALNAEIPEPTAFSLATLSAENLPKNRIVLLKGATENSLHFYTNYQSQKGQDLEANPFAAACFYWPELQRQVRVEGSVSKLSREESEIYFKSRPKASQIGAHVSPQSQPISSREFLERKYRELSEYYSDQEIPLPQNWGGYALHAKSVEFWQGRESRLHDRIVFKLNPNRNWEIQRLAP